MGILRRVLLAAGVGALLAGTVLVTTSGPAVAARPSLSRVHLAEALFHYPRAVASDGTHVWVANDGGPSVTELSAKTGGLVQVISGPSYKFSQPGAIASDGTHVWVANYSNSVTELSAKTGDLVQVLSGPSFKFNAPDAVASDGTHVWVANFYGNTLTELSARTASLVQVISG